MRFEISPRIMPFESCNDMQSSLDKQCQVVKESAIRKLNLVRIQMTPNCY